MTRRMLLIGASVTVLGAGAWALVAHHRQPGTAPAPASAASAIPNFTVADPPRPAPRLAFVDKAGRSLSLDAFKGRAVLLNLWATWCAPCVKELPALDRLAAALGGPDFAVVALSLDRGGLATVEPFLARLGITSLTPYLDPGGEAMNALALRSLPTSVLLDRAGNEVGRLEGGADWDGAEARAFLRSVIDRRDSDARVTSTRG